MKANKKILFLLFALLCLFVVGFVYPLMSYEIACNQYEQIKRLKPATVGEVENILSLYLKRKIEMSQSRWGKDHQLGRGEYCLQYLILGKQPIDIVYDAENKVKVVYPSFE